VTRIDIEPTETRGERGQRYRVHHAGEVLTEETWCPEYDAARALVAKGIAGRVEIWRDGKAASTMDIEGAAESTIVENANTGPRLGKWVPFSPYGPVAGQDAVSRGWVAPPAAVPGRPGTADEDGRW
jgi:hypothetical protein